MAINWWGRRREENAVEPGGSLSFGGNVSAQKIEPRRVPPTPVTVADHLDLICEEKGCRYEILTGDRGKTIRLLWDDGDALTGTGEDIKEALAVLREKLGGVE